MVLNGEYSDWVEVTSGVPQGSVLGPVLFVIFINDIDEGIINRIWKFADDTKLLGKVVNREGIEALNKDIERLFIWSQEWQMSFNLDKCKIMHIGYNNSKQGYEMGGSKLVKVSEEKDLGV